MVVFYHMTENEVKNYANFHLSIEINPQFIHLLLIDKSNKKAVAMESISLDEKELSSVFNESEIIQKSAQDTVSCAIQNSAFTLVPNSIFQESESSTYLDFNQSSIESFEVNNNKLVKQEITNCFGIDKASKEILSGLFPNIKYLHIGSVLIDSLSDGFHINFSSEKEFEVTVIENKKLVFFNRFIAENTDETLYYLSLVAEKLKLDIQKIKIGLSGMIGPKDENFLFWSQFIPKENLNFNEIETSQLNAISTHRFFTLHKQIQCV
jgi:hypothetical protein